MKFQNIYTYAPIALSLFLIGCDMQDEKNKQLSQDLSQTLDEAHKLINEFGGQKDKIKGLATSEAEKLFQLEYKVYDFTKNSAELNLSEELNKLGKERWDCFHVIDLGEKIQFFCKRTPQSYLRYIPRLF